jgi:predicted dienelactone hydrolase
MRLAKFFVAVTLCLITTLAQAAGFRFIEVPVDADGPVLKGAMWYPCAELPGEIQVGPFTVAGVKDCPVSGAKLPLVVVSHGWGGDDISHHDLAEALADAGFVVAAVTHPLDRAPDGSIAGGLPDFIERPTDSKRLIDFMLEKSPAASRIDPQRIGFFGFSFGGYTGLALLGAEPDWIGDGCVGTSAAPICGQIRKEKLRIEPLPNDRRIKAAVIADPCCLWFAPDSIASIRAPLQLWASDHEIKWAGFTMPSVATVAAVDKNLAVNHEYHVVPNSAHFAFLFVCPPALAKAAPEICTDRPGFDRAPFHKEFNAAVLAFLRANLGGNVATAGPRRLAIIALQRLKRMPERRLTTRAGLPTTAGQRSAVGLEGS